MKIVAHYFPQFYSIPINDKNWGEGFTDWENVRKGEKLFEGHYQPRVPLNNNYYDQSDDNVLKNQVQLAKNYKIDAFCFYHYWFDGEKLLEKPVENFLTNKELDIEFCLSWANETWSKRWEGKDKIIIKEQKHKPFKKNWLEHFNYLLPFWKDKRYIKIDNKPIFLIYQPEIINDFEKMKNYWEELAIKEGFKGVHFIATKSYEFKNLEFILKNYQGIVNFQPRQIYNSGYLKAKSLFSNKFFQKLRFLPEKILNNLTSIRYKLKNEEVLNYDDVWEKIIEQEKKGWKYSIPVYSGVFVGWDNTARYGRKATIYKGANPIKFSNYMDEIIKINMKRSGENIIFINAWNEWSEGAYLEPDEKYKYDYLKNLKKVIEKYE